MTHKNGRRRSPLWQTTSTAIIEDFEVIRCRLYIKQIHITCKLQNMLERKIEENKHCKRKERTKSASKFSPFLDFCEECFAKFRSGQNLHKSTTKRHGLLTETAKFCAKAKTEIQL